MSAYASTIVIEAPPDQVFEFVAVPENQPRWAINFVRSTRRLDDGGYVMETPAGELRYRIDADPERRVIDWVFASLAGESVLPARVVPHPAGSAFSFTILRMPGTSDEDWERGRRGLDEELGVLKGVLEER
jgi:uncharacterized protein YndB with AHSA1/START domain